MKAKECMCQNVAYVTPESTICDCTKLMENRHVGSIPVCDNQNNLVGFVTDRDIILRSIACDKDIKTTPVSDIMTCKVCSCTPDTDIKDVEEIMSNYQIRRLPVVDNNQVVGIVTLGDLWKNPNTNKDTVCDTSENICKCNEKNAE